MLFPTMRGRTLLGFGVSQRWGPTRVGLQQEKGQWQNPAQVLPQVRSEAVTRSLGENQTKEAVGQKVGPLAGVRGARAPSPELQPPDPP